MRIVVLCAWAQLSSAAVVARTDAQPRAALPLTMTCEQECRDAAVEARGACRNHRDEDPSRARCEDVVSAALEVCLRFCDD